MKTAVILLSMGGPASLMAVRPFLFNLFKDPAILRLPFFIRIPLAFYVARKREKKAIENYKKLGGRSPLLENTEKQARALEAALSKQGAFRCFVGMRYAPPFVEDVMMRVKQYAPDNLVFLPLYPQYSMTTTGSSLQKARQEAKRHGLKNTTEITSFHKEPGFIETMAQNTTRLYEEAKRHGTPKIIFTAHGLPLSIVAAGDPYPQQCEETVAAILALLEKAAAKDAVLAYQSRVGRGAWLEPSTRDVLDAAAQDKRPVVLVPIAFVCEHVETLVELAQDYKARGLKAGAPFVEVVPTVGTAPRFIEGLAALIVKNMKKTRK